MDESIGTIWLWAAFVGFVLAMLALDLGLFHRRAHAVRVREALGLSAMWVTLAMLFAGVLWWWQGSDVALTFVAAWVIEKSLSVDNLFVFIVVLGAFRVPAVAQHRVLFWGVLGAIVLRAAMILLGVVLLEHFHWLMYVFGALLAITGLKLLLKRGEPSAEDGVAVRLVRRVVPSTPDLHGQRFFVRAGRRWVATPLLLALLSLEATDVIFAADSIPAVFAVTTDPFLVFTSNLFALLGLRSLFFVLAGLMARLPYLKHALAAVLIFVGVKMTLSSVLPIHPGLSLGVITALLGAGVAASLLRAPVPARVEPAPLSR